MVQELIEKNVFLNMPYMKFHMAMVQIDLLKLWYMANWGISKNG